MTRQIRVTGLVLALTGALLVAPSVYAEDKAPQATDDGLVKVKSKTLDLAYVRPGVDWNKYKTIYLLPLSIPTEARDGSGGSNRSARPGESYILRDSDVEVMKKNFDRVMREQLQKDGHYTLVDKPQADTLVIATEIARLVLAAPLESTRTNYAGRGRTFTQGGGAATIAAAFADGTDYKVLARIVDNRYAPDTWGENNSVTNLADLDMMYDEWGKGIRKRLQDIQAGKIAMP